MNNVMILGAGVYQIPLINAAKRLGYRTLVASVPGNYPGFEVADECVYVDTRDAQTLLEVAKDKKIIGVVTACTDVPVPSIGLINDEMGLAGVGLKSAMLSSNKIEMKKAFKKSGVNTAEFEIVPLDASEESCAAISEKIGYPVIFKAIDSSGSRGIMRVFTKKDIAQALHEVRQTTRESSFLIERYLVGVEFGMQGFVQGGEIGLVMLHGDYLFQGETAVPMGHYVPYGEGNNGAAELEARKAIESLGITDGAVNIDAIYSENKVYIIEVGARAGATCLPELVSLRYDCDYYEMIVRNALGENVDIPHVKRNAAAAMILCPANEGIISAIECLPSANDTVKNISLDYGPGDMIKKFSVGPDRIGQVVVAAGSLDNAESILMNKIKEIRIRLDGGKLVEWATPERGVEMK